MARNQGGRSSNRGGRGSNNQRSRRGGARGNTTRSTGTQEPKKAKLEDHVFNTGSARNASEYVTNVKYILNYIRIELDEGDDIANALQDGKEFDHTAVEPVLKASVATDATKKELEQKQFEIEFSLARSSHNKRIEWYRKNKNTVAALLWRQCSEKMKSKVSATNVLL